MGLGSDALACAAYHQCRPRSRLLNSFPAPILLNVKTINGLDSPDLVAALGPQASRCALTIGNFDGVHRGHQQIIAQAALLAANAGDLTVVVTFEPHPLSVVTPAKAPARLMPPEEKLACLAAAGADITVVIEANRDLLSTTAEDFIERLAARLHPGHIVEGSSFGFGRGRTGTVDTLRSLGRQRDFHVTIVDPVRVQLDGETKVDVSSSLIRTLVAEGRVHRAALCLGRPYTLIGRVTTGQRRGVTLGYPTANLAVDDQLVPADGVYAGFAVAGTARRPAAISIGTTPTFSADPQRPGDGPQSKIEAYLLDAEVDLYNQDLRLEFGKWLREQQRFESAGELRAQIAKDVEAVRQHAGTKQQH